jgi:hypothetical protein
MAVSGRSTPSLNQLSDVCFRSKADVNRVGVANLWLDSSFVLLENAGWLHKLQSVKNPS